MERRRFSFCSFLGRKGTSLYAKERGDPFKGNWRKTRPASGGTKKTGALLRNGISLLRRRQCVVGKFLPLSSCVVRCRRREEKDQDGSARRVSLSMWKDTAWNMVAERLP